MSDPKRGDKVRYRATGHEVRVMAVADGYAMVRVPGALPFVAWLKDLVPSQED